MLLVLVLLLLLLVLVLLMLLPHGNRVVLLAHECPRRARRLFRRVVEIARRRLADNCCGCNVLRHGGVAMVSGAELLCAKRMNVPDFWGLSANAGRCGGNFVGVRECGADCMESSAHVR